MKPSFIAAAVLCVATTAVRKWGKESGTIKSCWKSKFYRNQ